MWKDVEKEQHMCGTDVKPETVVTPRHGSLLEDSGTDPAFSTPVRKHKAGASISPASQQSRWADLSVDDEDSIWAYRKSPTGSKPKEMLDINALGGSIPAFPVQCANDELENSHPASQKKRKRGKRKAHRPLMPHQPLPEPEVVM
jgi:hypothetical protein